jgi:cytochrome c551/c552
MLLATILVLVAAGLCAVIYVRDSSTVKDQEFFCGTVGTDSILYSNTEGPRIFNQNCASCHHVIKNGTGPALKDLDNRFPMDLFREYMINPANAIKKSKYLKKLHKDYGNIEKPSFNLSDSEIEALIDLFIRKQH